ncbi:MAG: hypothetical protein SGPRY_011376 [Prymnesium sp.]
MGLLVAGISIAVTANSATGSKQALVGTKQGNDLTTTLEDGTAKERSSDEVWMTAFTAKLHDGDKVEFGRESWWYYHVMMIACSLYMAMLLTDWSNMPAERNGEETSVYGPLPASQCHILRCVGVPAVEMLEQVRQTRYGVDLVSFWVKLASQWICMLMYESSSLQQPIVFSRLF